LVTHFRENNATIPEGLHFGGWPAEPSCGELLALLELLTPSGNSSGSLPATFRNCSYTTTWNNLPATLPEPFRNLPELQQNRKMQNNLPATLPETFRNLPELGEFDILHFEGLRLMRVTSNNKDNAQQISCKGVYVGCHIYIYIYIYIYYILIKMEHTHTQHKQKQQHMHT